MGIGARGCMAAIVTALLTFGCGVRLFDRWDGGAEQRRDVPAPPDEVWQRIASGLEVLDLVVEEIRPQERMILFSWMTAPGDGREYIVCDGTERVGSASLRPRILLVPRPGGTSIVVSSEARGTAARSCESTGRFEQSILARLEPVIAGADPAGTDAGDPRAGNPQR